MNAMTIRTAVTRNADRPGYVIAAALPAQPGDDVGPEVAVALDSADDKTVGIVIPNINDVLDALKAQRQDGGQ